VLLPHFPRTAAVTPGGEFLRSWRRDGDEAARRRGPGRTDGHTHLLPDAAGVPPLTGQRRGGAAPWQGSAAGVPLPGRAARWPGFTAGWLRPA